MDSQGFCCNCQFLSMFGLDNNNLNRGNLCDALDFGSASTAHCLKFDQLWYSGYLIGQYSIYYEIDVTVQESDAQGNLLQSYQLHLGSATRVQKSSDGNVIATVIGDFSPVSPPASLDSYYLMKPSRPATHTRVLESTR